MPRHCELCPEGYECFWLGEPPVRIQFSLNPAKTESSGWIDFSKLCP